MSAQLRPSHSMGGSVNEIAPLDVGKTLCNRLMYSTDSVGSPLRDPFNVYKSTALSVRDKMIDKLNTTTEFQENKKVRFINYCSIEFLMGRALRNNLLNLDLEEQVRRSLQAFGYDLDRICDEEFDAGLGNGGLGRLAACFLDSFATLNLPAWGYGLRYDYGIFKQKIQNNEQVEIPDYWLKNGNPWELERPDVQYEIRFYGRCVNETVEGKQVRRWIEGETFIARAFDNPITGFGTNNVVNLRLWKCLASEEFDFKAFNDGQYFDAIKSKNFADFISSVLYPNDSMEAGRELRLKQQYFFVCATVQDIMKRFSDKFGNNWNEFPDHMGIQLNDTHPTLAVIELLRILIDKFNYTLTDAFRLCQKVFNYTNHTILPEALEKWSVDTLGKLLPRHLEIIYDLNQMFMDQISKTYPGDVEKMSVLSLIEESTPKRVRMANICVLISTKVNGVSNLHYELIRDILFKQFASMHPEKFMGITNGVTIRRWVYVANTKLSAMYTKYLGNKDWLVRTNLIEMLLNKVDDPTFAKEWSDAKDYNKRRLMTFVKEKTGIDVDPTSCFDVIIKRFHEYKRQFMFILYIICRWQRLRRMSTQEKQQQVKRTFFFGGKAAPGYVIAKYVIKFINKVATVINNDRDTSQYLKIVFIPNYNVSTAEIIIPAADFNQQISCAGTEASGTSNMKFVLNGSIIVGTFDGANIEISEKVTRDNILIFGLNADEVLKKREQNKSAPDIYATFPQSLQDVFGEINRGTFGNARNEFGPLIDSIQNSKDFYLIGSDFESYVQAMQKSDDLYKDKAKFSKLACQGALRTATLSSDRCINEYAEKIWHIQPCKVTQ